MKYQAGELLELAKRRPDSPALESQEGTVTTAELIERVDLLMRYFTEQAISRLGLIADNSADWVVADLASQAQGICLVPIPSFFSDRQIAHVLRSAAIEHIACDTGNGHRVETLSSSKLTKLPGTGDLYCLAVGSELEVALPSGSNKVTYTSGSTGEAKGVCLSFAQCQRVAQSLAAAVDFKDGWRHLCALPLSTLLENIAGVYMPLLSGGTALVYATDALGMAGSSELDVSKFLQAIDRLQPQTMILVPQLLNVLDAAMIGGWKPPDSLKFVAVGGGRVAPAIVARICVAGLPIYEGYGLSECASVVSLNTPTANRLGTSGMVLPHLQVSNNEGEIVVSGEIFLGYLNQPDSWGKTSVNTGDVGCLDEQGYVIVAGRCKNILISSFGRNISPEWVESELLSFRFFIQAVVVGDDRPSCAALLLPAKTEVSDAQIQWEVDRVNKGLPDYAQVKQWLRMTKPLTVGNGMLTDNGRLKRPQINQQYGAEIDEIYDIGRECIAL